MIVTREFFFYFTFWRIKRGERGEKEREKEREVPNYGYSDGSECTHRLYKKIKESSFECRNIQPSFNRHRNWKFIN